MRNRKEIEEKTELKFAQGGPERLHLNGGWSGKKGVIKQPNGCWENALPAEVRGRA